MPAPTLLPSTMKAICFTQAGAPDVLLLETIQVPQPGRGEVLVRVMAAGVNRPDIMQRKGFIHLRPEPVQD